MINADISVIVATKNRHYKVTNCIKSILSNSYKKFDLIIIDQSSNNLTKNIIKKINHDKIKYYKLHSSGKTKALNSSLGKTRSNLLLFTDDDCVVSTSWIKTVKKTFDEKPDVDAIFGPVFPYSKTKMKDSVCPSTFTKNKSRIFLKPTIHQKVGSGNNMAFRKNTLLKIGKFKTWMGPGSISKSGDDAELIIRSLVNGCRILYLNSNNFVYHNRWLNSNEFKELQLSYLLSDTICYSYHLFDFSLARKRILKRFKINFWRYAHLIKEKILLKKLHPKDLVFNPFSETYILLKGFTLGICFKILKL